jgi:hypothetical protein
LALVNAAERASVPPAAAPVAQGPSPASAPAPAPARPPKVAVPAGRDPLWHSPLFVLAPARSHSTVVATMIGMHPQTCGFPELALFRRPTVAELAADPPGWRGVPARARSAGLLRALAQADHGGQTDEAIGAALGWLEARSAWTGEHVYDHLLASVAPRIGVQKSPEDSSRDEYLARVVAAYPRARFLHLTRHPLTSVASMHRVWKDLGYWNIAPELFHNFCVGVWYHQHRRIETFVSSLPPDRGFRMRAEDVLNTPEEALTAVCRWLGVDSSPQAVEAMRHAELAPYAWLGPPSARGGGDGGFLRDPIPHATDLPPSLELPQEWAIDPWLLMTAIELARRFGYGDPAAGAG